MTRQTSDSRKPDRDTGIIVLFGTDEHGKPRAARFEGGNVELIGKAAEAMKLQLLRPQSASQIELAKKRLPVEFTPAARHSCQPYRPACLRICSRPSQPPRRVRTLAQKKLSGLGYRETGTASKSVNS
jgi:hypothetical protein